MSSKWAREQKREAERRQAVRAFSEREAERRRRAALTMWERIEEAEASADVKEILHMMAEKVGLE